MCAACSCGHFFGTPVVGAEAIHHLLHCRDNVGKTHTTRHREVVRAIEHVLFTSLLVVAFILVPLGTLMVNLYDLLELLKGDAVAIRVGFTAAFVV